MKGKRAVGGGERVTGTEGGTRRDEHWVLFCMLANRTLIKSQFIIKKRKKQSVAPGLLSQLSFCLRLGS